MPEDRLPRLVAEQECDGAFPRGRSSDHALRRARRRLELVLRPSRRVRARPTVMMAAAADTTATSEAGAYSGRTAWVRNLDTPLRTFLRTETGSAAVLLAGVVAALVWANVD